MSSIQLRLALLYQLYITITAHAHITLLVTITPLVTIIHLVMTIAQIIAHAHITPLVTIIHLVMTTSQIIAHALTQNMDTQITHMPTNILIKFSYKLTIKHVIHMKIFNNFELLLRTS